MSFTQRTAQALLNSLFGKSSNFGALGSAPTIHVGLSSTTPTESGGNITEPSTGSYARVETAAADWNAATNADPSVIDNAEVIEFPAATADWVAGADLTHVVLFDASSAGNALAWGALGTAKPVLNGDSPSFAAGELNITLD